MIILCTNILVLGLLIEYLELVVALRERMNAFQDWFYDDESSPPKPAFFLNENASSSWLLDTRKDTIENKVLGSIHFLVCKRRTIDR